MRCLTVKIKLMGLAYEIKVMYLFLRTCKSISTALCQLPVEANQCKCLDKVLNQNLNSEVAIIGLFCWTVLWNSSAIGTSRGWHK